MFLVIERRVGSRIRKLCHLAKNNDRERRTSIMIVCVCGFLKSCSSILLNHQAGIILIFMTFILCQIITNF